jgi:malate synthase
MAAYIPRKDEEANRIAFAAVRQDKVRESSDGFDGTWIAHPGLVPVVREVFEDVLGNRPHQKERMREDVYIGAADLMAFDIPGGTITEDGVRLNVNVALLYLESWLRGVGAAAIYNLMEDTATAEISRAQLWQWINNPGATLEDGRAITLELVQSMIPEEMAKINELVGDEWYEQGEFVHAREILEQLLEAETFIGFLTLLAYDYLD